MTNDPGRFKAGPSFVRPNPPASKNSTGDHRPDSGANSNADLAQALVDRGLPILPLRPENKKPLTTSGFYDARTYTSGWRRCPNALIGIPTAGFWVLDLDPPLEVSVQTICRLLCCEWRELTAACPLIVRTPRGGFHFYWQRSQGVAIRNDSGDIGEGIDTRGHDAKGKATGYIVAPGCVLPDGRRYAVEKGSFDAIVDGLCEPAPSLLWLGSLSRSERARIAAIPELTAAMRAAEPSAWREILAAHDIATRAKLPKLNLDDTEPMRRQALHDLDAERQRLASLFDGRRNAVHKAALRLARYSANAILHANEIEAGLLEAWEASGAAAKNGSAYPRGAIRRGLEKGRNDPLPPLMRRFRKPDGSGR
jgi:hypothetical protein